MSPAMSPSRGAGGWDVEGDAKAEGAVGVKAKGDFIAICSSVLNWWDPLWMCPLIGREITAQVRTEVPITECFLPCRQSNIGTRAPAVGSPSTKQSQSF